MTLSPGIFTTILSTGCFAVRDAGDRHGHVLRFRNERPGTDREPVILKASGNAWHKQGRYGNMLGKPLGDFARSAETVARETAQADLTKNQAFPFHWGPMREAKVFCMANLLSRK